MKTYTMWVHWIVAVLHLGSWYRVPWCERGIGELHYGMLLRRDRLVVLVRRYTIHIYIITCCTRIVRRCHYADYRYSYRSHFPLYPVFRFDNAACEMKRS